METLLQERDHDNKHRMQELAGDLISNSIMPQLVQQQLDECVHKCDALEAEVSQGFVCWLLA